MKIVLTEIKILWNFSPIHEIQGSLKSINPQGFANPTCKAFEMAIGNEGCTVSSMEGLFEGSWIIGGCGVVTSGIFSKSGRGGGGINGGGWSAPIGGPWLIGDDFVIILFLWKDSEKENNNYYNVISSIKSACYSISIIQKLQDFRFFDNLPLLYYLSKYSVCTLSDIRKSASPRQVPKFFLSLLLSTNEFASKLTEFNGLQGKI